MSKGVDDLILDEIEKEVTGQVPVKRNGKRRKKIEEIGSECPVCGFTIYLPDEVVCPTCGAELDNEEWYNDWGRWGQY